MLSHQSRFTRRPLYGASQGTGNGSPLPVFTRTGAILREATSFNSSVEEFTIWCTMSGSIISVELGPNFVIFPATVHSPEPLNITITSSHAWQWTGVEAPGAIVCTQTSIELTPCLCPPTVWCLIPGRSNVSTCALSMISIGFPFSHLMSQAK